MNYTKTTPCGTCPWRKNTPCVLTAGRVIELQENILASEGGEFPCHKTIGYEDDGDSIIGEDAMHCAGALIFAEKQGRATQMMRICERIGMYDAAKLMTNNPAVKEVFDTPTEMKKHHAKQLKKLRG